MPLGWANDGEILICRWNSPSSVDNDSNYTQSTSKMYVSRGNRLEHSKSHTVTYTVNIQPVLSTEKQHNLRNWPFFTWERYMLLIYVCCFSCPHTCLLSTPSKHYNCLHPLQWTDKKKTADAKFIRTVLLLHVQKLWSGSMNTRPNISKSKELNEDITCKDQMQAYPSNIYGGYRIWNLCKARLFYFLVHLLSTISLQRQANRQR